MDSITQAALGAAIGEAVLGRKIGNRAIAWGLFFGTLPDLDVIANPLLDTARQLAFHRGPSHSILLMVIATFLLARPLARLWKKDKVTPARAGIFIFLVWSTHVLIDCFTVYGTSVLWPFSETRVAFNHMFIIDPLYTLPLIISLIALAFYRSKKNQQKRTKILSYGLGLSTLYVGFSIGMKFYASAAFDRDLAKRGVTYQRRMEAPTVFNTLLWRSVADMGDEYWVGYRSVFEKIDNPIRWVIYPKNDEAIIPFEGKREVETLKWFTRGWWIARPHADGLWIADMRFGETRNYGAKPGTVDSRFIFAWSYITESLGDHIQSSPPSIRDPKQALQKIFRRIILDENEWEGKPRLAGVTGRLPEYLRYIE